MPAINSDFEGAIPDIYDSYLVPILFAPYGADLAQRVASHHPARVLEIAAGTGAVTRALAPLLDPGAHYVATDLNQAMLDRARARDPSAAVTWQQADALALPFADDSFDLVFCQFGVMFFPDRVAGFSEIRRVLRPGGRFIFNSWGPLARNDFSRITVEMLRRLYPEDPPLFLARTPFGYADKARIEQDLMAAGFTRIEIEELAQESRAQTAADFAFGQICGSPLRREIEDRAPPALEAVCAEVARAIEGACGANPARGRMLALVTEAA